MVRLTSPNLNYLIIAGALLLYASVVFLVTPTLEEETATIYCNVSVVMEPLLPQARARVLVISAVDLTHLVLIQPFSINPFSANSTHLVLTHLMLPLTHLVRFCSRFNLCNLICSTTLKHLYDREAEIPSFEL